MEMRLLVAGVSGVLLLPFLLALCAWALRGARYLWKYAAAMPVLWLGITLVNRILYVFVPSTMFFVSVQWIPIGACVALFALGLRRKRGEAVARLGASRASKAAGVMTAAGALVASLFGALPFARMLSQNVDQSFVYKSATAEQLPFLLVAGAGYLLLSLGHFALSITKEDRRPVRRASLAASCAAFAVACLTVINAFYIAGDSVFLYDAPEMRLLLPIARTAQLAAMAVLFIALAASMYAHFSLYTKLTKCVCIFLSFIMLLFCVADIVAAAAWSGLRQTSALCDALMTSLFCLAPYGLLILSVKGRPFPAADTVRREELNDAGDGKAG